MLCIFSGSKAFSISSPFYFLKAFQASLNIFQKKNRKKESRYEVLTIKKTKGNGIMGGYL